MRNAALVLLFIHFLHYFLKKLKLNYFFIGMKCLTAKNDLACTPFNYKYGCYCMYPLIEREIELVRFYEE